MYRPRKGLKPLIGLTATAALLLTACGGDGGNGGGDSAGELTVWTVTGADDGPEASPGERAFHSLVTTFEEDNPGVEVNIEVRGPDAHKDALRQVAGTSAAPDIYWYWAGPGLAGELIDQGMSLPLEDYYAEYNWQDRFTSAAYSTVDRYEGLHGVPWSMQGEVLFYNKELFAAAGINEEPQTYDELISANDKLVAAGITPIQFGGTVNWYIMRLLDNLIETFCGSELADQLTSEQVGWDSESCVTEAYGEMKRWADEYFNDGYMALSDAEGQQLFYTEQAAMALEASWFGRAAVENGLDEDKVGYFLFPTGTGRLYGFGENFYISATSENADLAAKFLDFGTSDSFQEQTTGAFSPVSVNRSVAPDPEVAINAHWPTIFDQSTGMFLNNDQNFPAEATTEYWRIQNLVLLGDMDPEAAGTAMQQFLDENN